MIGENEDFCTVHVLKYPNNAYFTALPMGFRWEKETKGGQGQNGGT